MTLGLVNQAPPAVCVRNAYKQYDSANVILRSFNMTVPKGTIYGLLGATGCGKTTLLSCIVGIRKLESGDIWALGGKPATRSSGVPGIRLGYMPQDLALYDGFDIRETMLYFGWIGGKSTEEVNVRLAFLVRLLDLPSLTEPVKNLSGGQQRRVSLAAALLHDPELLVLDEPTVGLDPVLRQNIWNYLTEITKSGRTTVLLTTHYIEESRRAHVIGLMRGGKLLAEDAPDTLLRHYEMDNLEDVFLKLAIMQHETDKPKTSTSSHRDSSTSHLEDVEHHDIYGRSKEKGSKSTKNSDRKDSSPLDLPEDDPPKPLSRWNQISPVTANHMKALVWKNSSILLRNFGLLAFIILLPITQTIIFCVAIGHDPKGLKVNVVNYELGPDQRYDKCEYDKDACFGNRSSCRFLDYYSRGNSDLVAYDSAEKALANAKKGYAVVVMIFPANFSQALKSRLMDSQLASEEELFSSSIEVHVDNTNRQTEAMLIRDIQEAFVKFCDTLAIACHMPKRYFSVPVKFDEPVYGIRKPTFIDFSAPGITLTVVFFLALALSSGTMLVEKNEGIFERLLICGVTATEILVSHSIVQTAVLVIQTVCVLVFGFLVFKLTCHGPFLWVVALIFMVGFCGMTYGFLISTLCNTDHTANFMTVGSYLPMFFLAGVMWPAEGMPKAMQYVSKVLPLGTTIESLRSMLQRGWSVDRPTVYIGFAATGGWIIFLLTLSILLNKRA